MRNTSKKIQEAEIETLNTTIEEQKCELFRLQAVIDNLPGSIYWKDKKGIYLGRNLSSAEKMHSINLEHTADKDAIYGKTDYDFFSKEVADQYRKHDIEVMEKKCEVTKEEYLTLPTGETIIQISTKRPLYDEHGEITGIIGNTVDISYLKKIENELRQATKKAEEANQLKTEFIRNMQHDIRTPLSGIWGIANYIYEQENDVSKKELLNDLALCSKELLNYVNILLDFSRIELGGLPLSFNKFKLIDLVDKLMMLEMLPAKQKQLDLILKYDDKIPEFLIGDDYRLYSILINIVSNAIKFTEKGTVTILIKAYQQYDDNLVIQFIVEDTGIGIPANLCDWIYEKFTRVYPANKGTFKGTGLGLHVVRQFIEELKGEIKAESTLNKGTTFSCLIPFKTLELSANMNYKIMDAR